VENPEVLAASIVHITRGVGSIYNETEPTPGDLLVLDKTRYQCNRKCGRT